MQVKTVRRYTTPDYPTRDYLLEHPELLKWVPKRWRHSPLVLGVLSMLIPLILARPAPGGSSQDENTANIRVAPIFTHGDGRGAFGCIVVNPPEFLSEDEARQVVQDEAKKAGIDFTPDGLTLKEATVPVTDQFSFLKERDEAKEESTGDKETKPKTEPTQKLDLVLDGYDKKQNIAYEIVSMQDFAAWEKKDQGYLCTVSSYNFKTTGERLAKGLGESKGDTVVAVFYEPGASTPADWVPPEDIAKDDWEAKRNARKKASKELGEKELRAQVREFLEWLKAQGII